MKTKPILFSGPMVRAILEGSKTQTRRVVNPQPIDPYFSWGDPYNKRWVDIIELNGRCRDIKVPYNKGDRLWVRETTGEFSGPNRSEGRYAADGSLACDGWNYSRPVRPSIHMPKSMARIWLKITSIRIERLQAIKYKDAIAEGVPSADDYPIEEIWCRNCKGEGTHGAIGPNLGWCEVDCNTCDTVLKRFRNFWENINGKKCSWVSNPWVWVIHFKKEAP